MKKRLKDKKGYTLVELIVVFGLIALFLGTASMVLGVFFETHLKINTVAQAQTVAATLMETITSELGAATNTEVPMTGDPALAGNVDTDDQICKIGNDIYYYDYNWYLVKMSVVDGYLQLQYSGGNGSDGGAVIDASSPSIWAYGENVYNGFKIVGLDAVQLNDSNRLKVTLRLQSDKLPDYIYESSRSFECYNLNNEQINI